MNHTLSHRVAGYECTLCWFSWSLEFTNWWRRLDLIRDMCCSRLYASEKHSEREEKGERWKNGAWALYFSSVCSSGHCLIWGLVGLERRRRERKKNLTSTLGQETRDSHSDPAFLTIITSKFLCGISVSRGAAHPLNTKANKIIKLKNKAKNHNSVVILLNQTRQESRAMLATLWGCKELNAIKKREKVSMLTCSHEKANMLTFSRSNNISIMFTILV